METSLDRYLKNKGYKVSSKKTNFHKARSLPFGTKAKKHV